MPAKNAAKKAALSASIRKARERFLLEVTSLPVAAGIEGAVARFAVNWAAARAGRITLRRDACAPLITRRTLLRCAASGAVLLPLGSRFAFAAPEVLYNGITLGAPWPPQRRFPDEHPVTPPYLATPPAVVDAMKTAVKGMTGLAGHAVVTNRGFTKEADIVVPPEANAQTQQFADAVRG